MKAFAGPRLLVRENDLQSSQTRLKPRVSRLCCSVLLAWSLSTGDLASADDTDRFVGIDAYISAALQKWQVPGLAIAVVKEDHVVLARGYGLREIDTTQSVAAETLFPLASCSKSFVATAIALLVEDGKLAWDDRVVDHLTDFELSSPGLTQQVTLRDLLCHRTGLRRADLLADGAGFDSRLVLSRLKYLEPVAELRTRYIYNNHTYSVLVEVVRQVSGQPWEQFLTKRILQPLDMNSTTFDPLTVPPERVALRHWRSDAGIVARPIDRDMHSTVHDLAKWVLFQLAEGTFNGGQILKASTIGEMQSLQCSIPVTTRPKNNAYAARFLGSGLGWTVQDYRGRKIVSHGGAWGAMVGLMPDEGIGVVVLSNLDLEYLAALLMYDVFDAYLIGPEDAWSPAKWEATWLANEPPGAAYLPRDRANAELKARRISGTRPSLPLASYSGRYESPLYGGMVIEEHAGHVRLRFAGFLTDLSHWQHDSFYVRSPTRLTFDWLLTFRPDSKGVIEQLVVRHIGWDDTEIDHVFHRATE